MRTERESKDLLLIVPRVKTAGPSVVLAAQAPFALLQDDNY